MECTIIEESKSKSIAEILKPIKGETGFMVYEMGQDPAHALWFCVVLELFPDNGKKRYVNVEEYDTAEEAVQACVDKIQRGEFEYVKMKDS